MASEKPSMDPLSAFTGALVTCLLVMAVLCVILGFAGAFTFLTLHLLAERMGLATLAWGVTAVVAGCCAGTVLWALAWLCRKVCREESAQRRMARALEILAAPKPHAFGEAFAPAAEAKAPSSPAVRRGAASAGGDVLRAVLEELRELNANILLSEDERQAKRRRLVETRAKRLAEKAEAAIARGDLAVAEEHLRGLGRVAPDWPALGGLTERVRQARAGVEFRDADETGRRVEDLMSGGEFAQAEALAAALVAKYPSSEQAAALPGRVRREAGAFVAEQRRRMYQSVQKEASVRHWRAALSAAEKLLTAYPDSPEAEDVRAQLETLRNNAALEEARELRDRIGDLFRRRRFREALDLAKDLVERFPKTAAAEDLRQEMPRLELLAQTAERGQG